MNCNCKSKSDCDRDDAIVVASLKELLEVDLGRAPFSSTKDKADQQHILSTLSWYMFKSDFDDYCVEHGFALSKEEELVYSSKEDDEDELVYSSDKDKEDEEVPNRFDLEQQIMECWSVIDDIGLMAEHGASYEEFKALITIYEYKFNRMFNTFSNMITNGDIK